LSKKALEKILTGISDKNIKFSELRETLMKLGFAERVKGDHHIFTKDEIVEIINIQPLRNGKAKAYQVKQIRNLLLKYRIHKEVKDV
jgi:predicted RNA binding protein YcfA (HicA-like mRNA interferase family)